MWFSFVGILSKWSHNLFSRLCPWDIDHAAPCSAIFLGGSSFPFSCIPSWCLPLLAVTQWWLLWVHSLCMLLLMYSVRFLTSFSTVCLICRSPLPPILHGRYGLSMSLCGCRVRWAVMSFLILRSRSSISTIVLSTMYAVYLITGTAQLLIAWIVFPPFSLDVSILHALLVYSADVCFFHLTMFDVLCLQYT